MWVYAESDRGNEPLCRADARLSQDYTSRAKGRTPINLAGGGGGEHAKTLPPMLRMHAKNANVHEGEKESLSLTQ